jgi:hypothetical protein
MRGILHFLIVFKAVFLGFPAGIRAQIVLPLQLKEDLVVDRLIFISTMSAAAAAQAQKPAKTEGRFAGRDKEKDVRTSNCLAARGTNFYHHFYQF